MDLDVIGDQLDGKELQRSFAAEGMKPGPKNTGAVSLPDLQGTIRFKTKRFIFDPLSFSRLETTITISPAGMRANIDQAVACGITIKGGVDIVNLDLSVDLKLSATDAQLEPTTVCLPYQQNDIKGIYSLRADLTGQGNQNRLASSLNGNFEFSARNGEFIRSPGIDATFDYLNATGDFKVAFPDLNRETFPYRLIGIKGRIEGNIVVADEVNVNSSLLNLSGQGRVDLEGKQIDGKALIAVLKPVDEVIARIPVIGAVVGGPLVGIPIRVTGSLERPDVTYLSPADVGAELLNIPLRILGIPFRALRLFTPGAKVPDKDVTQ